MISRIIKVEVSEDIGDCWSLLSVQTVTLPILYKENYIVA